MIYEDVDGKPAVKWQIVDRETGLGIENQKLYRYLSENGKDLDENLFSFMTYEDYHKKEQEAFRMGADYGTGTKYNDFMASALIVSQAAEDGYKWTTETELGQAISTLGFAYASYRMYTSTGSKKVNVPEKKDSGGSGTGNINKGYVSGDDWENHFNNKYGSENVIRKGTAADFADIMQNGRRLTVHSLAENNRLSNTGTPNSSVESLNTDGVLKKDDIMMKVLGLNWI